MSAQSLTADAASSAVSSSSLIIAAPRVPLHRHALESIFSFLTLAELSAVSRVSREWSARTLSMSPLCASFSADLLVRVNVRSPLLARHVGCLSWQGSVEPLQLSRLIDLTPHLTDLSVPVRFDPAAPLLFPPRLLRLQLIADMTADDWNRTLVAVSSLRHLVDFGLTNEGFVLTADAVGAIDWTPLQQIRSLRALKVTSFAFAPDWTAAQQEQLRALPHLTSVSLRTTVSALQSLLREPHSLRWEEFDNGEPWLSDAVADAICTLPLKRFGSERAAVTGLQSIRCLARLSDTLTQLHLYIPLMQLSDSELESSLCRCVHLVELNLHSGTLTGDQLTKLLRCTPHLRRLSVSSFKRLESLACLTADGVPLLDSLHLSTMRHLPVGQLSLLRPQSQLRELHLMAMFDAELPESTLALLHPPSAWFARLASFKYFSPMSRRR